MEQSKDVPTSFDLLNLGVPKYQYVEIIPIPNRRQRRKRGQSNFSHQAIQAQRGLDGIGAQLSEVAGRYNKQVSYFSRNLTRIVFEGDPFIYDQLQTQRRLPGVLEEAHFANLETPFTTVTRLNSFEQANLFSKRAGGLTLIDVEEMELDEEGNLKAEDIKRIDGLYKQDRLKGILGRLPLSFLQEDPEAQRETQEIRQAIFLFACQKDARPEKKITVPESVRPLHDRLRGYLDYYMGRIMDFELGVWDEKDLVDTLASTRAWLPQTLGCYIPARLGITPSSAIKLYQSRAIASDLPTFSWEAGILPHMEEGARDALRHNALPADLTPNARYDPEMDEEAAQNLLGYYKNRKLSNQEAEVVFAENDQMIEKVTGAYAKPLYADIMRSKGRRLEFVASQGPFDKVTVTCQSKNSFIFILNFKDGRTQLTLEIGKDGRVYGVPAKLAIGNPYLFWSVFTDTLKPVLEGIRVNHPGVESVKTGAHRELSQQRKIVYVAPDIQDQAIRQPKIKTRGEGAIPATDGILHFREPSQVDQEQKRIREVEYSEAQLRGYLPRNVPDEVVDQLVKTLHGFEIGRVNLADRIHQAGEDVWEVKSKGWRLLVRHDAGRNYTLVGAGFRGDDDRVFRKR